MHLPQRNGLGFLGLQTRPQRKQRSVFDSGMKPSVTPPVYTVKGDLFQFDGEWKSDDVIAARRFPPHPFVHQVSNAT